MKNKNFQILEISTFLRIVLSVLPVSLDCLFFIGLSVYIIYSTSFDQIYLKTIKDISSKSIDILSKALNTIHSTTKKQLNEEEKLYALLKYATFQNFDPFFK
jgi:hypothetical protein